MTAASLPSRPLPSLSRARTTAIIVTHESAAMANVEVVRGGGNEDKVERDDYCHDDGLGMKQTIFWWQFQSLKYPPICMFCPVLTDDRVHSPSGGHGKEGGGHGDATRRATAEHVKWRKRREPKAAAAGRQAGSERGQVDLGSRNQNSLTTTTKR